MITALLVDDEPRAISRLTAMLRAHGGVEVIGTAKNTAEAEQFLMHRVPDVVFLDIDMPGPSGVHLVDKLPPGTKVVFVTAHDGHAIDAFRFGAVDYVLKPFDADRLKVTLRRLMGSSPPPELAVADARPSGGALPPSTVRLLFDAGRTVEILSLSGVVWIEAVQNYTRVQAAGRKPGIVRRTLREWEEMLATTGDFFRLDWSLIVRLAALRSTQWLSRDQTLLSFHGVDEPLAIGRAAMVRLRELLGQS